MDKELLRHKQQVNQIAVLQRSVVDSMTKLVRYLDGRTSKTEVVNQLKEIGTPDALKVVEAINELHKTTKTHVNTDLSGIEKSLGEMLAAVKQLPQSFPDAPEQLDTIKVSNLKEIDFSALEKAIKEIKPPIVDVKAPVLNVDKPDFKPLLKSMGDMVSAVKNIKYPEIPKVDLKILENNSQEANKHLAEANKKLETLIKQPKGGGGGGGTTSFQDTDGNAVRVELTPAGAIPVSGVAYDIRNISPPTDPEIATYKYFGFEERGGTNWRIMRKTLATNVFMYATGTSDYSTAWTNRASETYA